MKKKLRVIAVIVITCAVIALLLSMVMRGIHDALHITADTMVRDAANEVINDGVKLALKNNHEEILQWEKNEYGDIKFMAINTACVNAIATDALQYISSELAKLTYEGASVRMGDLFTSPYTIGRGPLLNIYALQSGSVVYYFETDAIEAGINQTQFSMSIIYEIPLTYYSGTVRGDMTVKAAVPLYDVIIVGDVPDTYAKMNEAADFMNLMP